MSEGWRDEALCAEVGTGLFYPPLGVSARPARRVCRLCPVTGACLEFALAHMTFKYDLGMFGVWAGTTPPQRLRMLGRDWDAEGAA